MNYASIVAHLKKKQYLCRLNVNLDLRNIKRVKQIQFNMMKKIYFILFAVFCCNVILMAAPYGLLINGSTKIEATSLSEKDFQDREQFLASCVALNQGDKVQLYDFGSGASWMCAIDPYGEYQKFSGGKSQGYLTCNTAGSYDFYIKLKYEDDMLYIGPGQNCGNVTPPAPDPNATYYVTGTAELVGADKAWSETAIAMTKNADNTFTHTFTDLADGTIYRMKVTNGTWDQNWGFNAVQNAPAGVAGDSDGNVVFKLATKGNVEVIFNGASITLNGDFTDEQPINGTSVPSECEDVMLQGFYWDSNQDDKGHGNTRWSTLQAQATEINAYFDLVWLPPSAKSSGGVGYHPKQYNNQNSDWGKRTELEELIATFHAGNTRVVADMVINHIEGKDGWCTFYEQNFGKYGTFPVDGSYICNGDEMNSDPDASECHGKATGGNDDGYGAESNYAAARDLAHDNEKVREMCRAYAKWMIDEMKYDGFRYDYCKGFHTSHVGDYNQAAAAYFSVMEYWDGNAGVLWERIQEASCNTLTFDFALKYTAFNNGIASGNYSGCKAPGLLGMGKGKYSVTFVDNHDSYQRDNNEFGGFGNSMKSHMKGKLLQCNAFMLSMPGVPCVFYPHWKEYKSDIAPMVLARKAVGVHSESAVSDEGDAAGYRATVTGTNGTLIIELGNRVSASQAGYTKAASGDGYAMWIKTNSAVVPQLIVTPGSTTYKTDSLKIEMRTAKLGTEPATIYYTLDGSDPVTSTTKQPYTGSLVIKGNVTLKAYATVGNLASEVQTHTYIYQAPQETPLTVKFLPPASWEKVYLYAWDGAALGGWPGMEWKTKDSDGWLFHVFPSEIRKTNIIFSNGAGEQTTDILLDKDACYEWDEASGSEVLSENCSLSNIPFQLMVNPEGKVYKTEQLTISMSTIGGGDNVAVYYTLDNSDPKESATLLTYTQPFTITGDVTLKAYAESNGEETEVQTHIYTYEIPQASPLTVAFLKPSDWTKVYLYSWNDGGATKYTGEWPGSEMTTTNANGFYYHQFDAVVKEVNFIFNNGSGTQTSDLWTDEDVCYTWENKKAVLVDCGGTDVEDVELESLPMLDTNLPMFNVLGQKVDATYHGIIIQNGHKYLR